MSDSVMTGADMFNIRSDAKIKNKKWTRRRRTKWRYTPKIYCSSDLPTSATTHMQQYYLRGILLRFPNYSLRVSFPENKDKIMERPDLQRRFPDSGVSRKQVRHLQGDCRRNPIKIQLNWQISRGDDQKMIRWGNGVYIGHEISHSIVLQLKLTEID